MRISLIDPHPTAYHAVHERVAAGGLLVPVGALHMRDGFAGTRAADGALRP